MPKTTKEMQGYVGMYIWLARNMPLSTTQALRELQQSKKHAFAITESLRAALIKTKALRTRWILAAPFDPRKETILQSDSSAYAMGWVMLQYDDNIKARRVVSMGSRAWPGSARRTPAYELESAGSCSRSSAARRS